MPLRKFQFKRDSGDAAPAPDAEAESGAVIDVAAKVVASEPVEAKAPAEESKAAAPKTRKRAARKVRVTTETKPAEDAGTKLASLPVGGSLAEYLAPTEPIREPDTVRWPGYMSSFHEKSKARFDIESAIVGVEPGDLVVRENGYRAVVKGSRFVLLKAERYFAKFDAQGNFVCALPTQPNAEVLDHFRVDRFDECVECLFFIVEDSRISAINFRAKNATTGLCDPIISAQNQSRRAEWAKLSDLHAAAMRIPSIPLRVVGVNHVTGTQQSRAGYTYNIARCQAEPMPLDLFTRISDWLKSGEAAFFESDVAPEFEKKLSEVEEAIGETLAALEAAKVEYDPEADGSE
jgi:hypothetical protein